MTKSKTVALVLGSGGARGYAHVGAIEVLVERGYDIIAISGCSMGALVGGIYAAGKLKEFKDWATGLDRFDILKLLDVSFSAPGAIRGEKVFSIVRDLIGDVLIEDLPVPYTAVATDLLKHKEIWFQEGVLHRAIRASVAIPSFMTPELVGGRVLVDGGLLNPLPIIPTISAHADAIVAVNLSYYDAHFEGRFYKEVEVKEDNRFEDWVAEVWGKAALFFDKDTKAVKDTKVDEEMKSDKNATANSNLMTVGNSTGEKHAAVDNRVASEEDAATDLAGQHVGQVNSEIFKTTDPDGDDCSKATANLTPDLDSIQQFSATEALLSEMKATPHATKRHRSLTLGKFEAMNMAFEAMQSSLTQYKLAGYPPDVLINIPKIACKTFDYHKAPELIQLGRELTSKALDDYENGKP